MAYVVKAGKGLLRIDYLAARELLDRRFGETRAFLFNGYDEAAGIPAGLQGFYEVMRASGMTIRLHPMTRVGSDHRQRRVDVDLAAHVVWQASLPAVRTIVLTTGDQDFIPAVSLAKERFRKELVLLTYGRHVHAGLRNLADAHLLFENHADVVAR